MSTGGGTLNPPSKKSRNKPSVLLSKEENDLVFKLLDDRCFTLSTAVVQLMLTEPPSHSKWYKNATGVVCFVKDNNVRGYFISVYDIDNVRGCVWQQEVFFGFSYKAKRPNFHTFEADSCTAGLYFADSAEASDFQRVVESKVAILDKRALNFNIGKQDPSLTPLDLNRALPNPPDQKKNKKKKDKNRPRYRKQDISVPTDFQHLGHISSNFGHDLEDPVDDNRFDPKYQEFFTMAGINNEQLSNPKYLRAIYDFVNETGGIDVCRDGMLQSMAKDNSRPTNNDSRDVPPNRPPHHRSGVAPLPPPAITPSIKSNSKSASHSSIPPAPPPPPSNMPPLPPPAPSFAPPSGPPPNLGGGVPPPPPPPPPPPSLAMPSAPQTNTKRPDGVPPPMDGRSALLEQIRKGAKLNPVEPNSQSSNPSSKSQVPQAGGRDALLKEIQQGRRLKPVEDRPTKPAKPATEADNFANNLIDALQRRLKGLKDSSSSEEDDEGFQWSDEDD